MGGWRSARRASMSWRSCASASARGPHRSWFVSTRHLFSVPKYLNKKEPASGWSLDSRIFASWNLISGGSLDRRGMVLASDIDPPCSKVSTRILAPALDRCASREARARSTPPGRSPQTVVTPTGVAKGASFILVANPGDEPAAVTATFERWFTSLAHAQVVIETWQRAETALVCSGQFLGSAALAVRTDSISSCEALAYLPASA